MDRMSMVIASPAELYVAGAVIAVIAFGILWQLLRGIRRSLSERVNVKAVLISKYEEDLMTGQMYVGSDAALPPGGGTAQRQRKYLLDFQEEDQTTHSFEVERNVYELLDEGDEGFLTYRQDAFLSFGSVRAGGGGRNRNSMQGTRKDKF